MEKCLAARHFYSIAENKSIEISDGEFDRISLLVGSPTYVCVFTVTLRVFNRSSTTRNSMNVDPRYVCFVAWLFSSTKVREPILAISLFAHN